jgi:DNA polymerase-3 subunit delta
MSKINLLYGDEDFLMDEEIKRIKKGFTDFNCERIDGSKADADRIISALSTISMLGGDRLVIIDDFDHEEEDEEKLFSCIKGAQDHVRVVFVYYGNVDKRRKFYKLMEKTAEIKEFKSYTEWEQDKALAWLVNRVKKEGKKISGTAANLLIEIVGLNLRMLDKEIEKIATYIGKKDQIDDGDVVDLASSGETDMFTLSNSLRDKDMAGSLKSLRRLFNDNEQPHMMLGMIAKLYRMMLQVKYFEQKGMNQFSIAQQLRAKPFFIKKCLEKTDIFTLDELAGTLRKLHAADMKLKTGSSPRITLEMLIPELCGSNG